MIMRLDMIDIFKQNNSSNICVGLIHVSDWMLLLISFNIIVDDCSCVFIILTSTTYLKQGESQLLVVPLAYNHF